MPRPCPRKHPTSYLSPPNCSAMQIALFSEHAVWLEHIFNAQGMGLGTASRSEVLRATQEWKFHMELEAGLPSCAHACVLSAQPRRKKKLGKHSSPLHGCAVTGCRLKHSRLCVCRYFGAFSASPARAPRIHQLRCFVHRLWTPSTVACSNNQCCGKPKFWDLISMYQLWHTLEQFLYLNSTSQNPSCVLNFSVGYR